MPEEDLADVQHQGCGGTLKCTATIVGGLLLGRPPEPHKYNIEGELIEQGYWNDPSKGSESMPLELWWISDLSDE